MLGILSPYQGRKQDLVASPLIFGQTSTIYLHLTSILLLSNLHLTSILPDTRALSPSLYSTFILLLSYLYLTSILLQSYLTLGHHPLHCILPSSYFYLTQVLSSSCNSLTLHNSYSMACETIFDLNQIFIKIHLTFITVKIYPKLIKNYIFGKIREKGCFVFLSCT